MKTRKKLLAAPLAAVLSLAAASAFVSALPANVSARQQYGALERGWRTGYSDGYQAGWNDQLRRAPADYSAKADYQRADRAYVAAYGSVEDYRDGYRQGFEVGYEAGYARRGFDSTLPPGLARRGDGGEQAQQQGRQPVGPNAPTTDDGGVSDSSSSSSSLPAPSSSSGAVRSDTVLLVELLNRLSTDVSQRGDRFEARVIEPREFEGAVVAGRLNAVERPGKVQGRATLQLDFEQIRLPGGDWEDFSAQVVEVVPTSGEGNVGDVDPEGGVRGRDSTKEDAVKVGGAAGIGAIIGAIAGGGKGAGIGAIIGGSVGTAGVLNQRGKEIRLEPGQQLRIRATGRR